MKKTLLIMLSPVALLVLLLLVMPQHFARSGRIEPVATATPRTPVQQQEGAATASVAFVPKGSPVTADGVPTAEAAANQDVVAYALTLLGTPYLWAGETPDGFDCSGFITHVYDQYGVQLPHSSGMQAEEGEQVTRQQARPGDLVIFTGTNPQVREPGHVGIVMSLPGDTIEFVHSSSNGGVKISQVEGSGYEKRFLQVRRVL